jgi:signal transduction histidine kinase
MLAAFGRRRERLSWQLWASHLAVVVITLVAVVGAILAAAGFWALRQGWAFREPAVDAQVISRAVGNLVRRDLPSSVLSVVLGELQNGGLRVTHGPFEDERGPRRFGPVPQWPDLGGLQFVVLLGADGRVLASSDEALLPVGDRLPDQIERASAPVTGLAWRGELETAQLSLPADGPAPAYGAYPILDDASARPLAVVLVAKPLPAPRGPAFLVARALAVFSLATIVVLTVASAFALVFSGAAAYLLARRLSRRLERLTRATAAMAQGDLSQRVEPGRPDEIGSLSEHFNLMAARLQENRSALELEKRRVETALRTKRELEANISHELRTPLALIRGHIESLELSRSARLELDREYLRVIQREVDNLNRLIEDLFALSTADTGGLSLHLEPLPLAQVVEQLVTALAPLARREQRVTVVAQINPDLPPVLADRQRLEQVVSNLVRNALRYTPEGGLVAIAARLGAPGRGGAPLVEVTVSDTGLGIPPEQLPQLFDRFFRGDPARERSQGGVGLGLAIVRELVEAMGGYVRVSSTVGQGSEFTFSLPIALPSPDSDGSTDQLDRAGSRSTGVVARG